MTLSNDVQDMSIEEGDLLKRENATTPIFSRVAVHQISSAFLLLMRCCQDQKVVSTNRLWQKQQTPLTLYGADPSPLSVTCVKSGLLLKRQWHSNFNVIVDNGRLCIVGASPCRCFTLSSECNHYLCLVIVFHFAHKKL